MYGMGVVYIKNTIGFCGTRGLPAHYGGFETAVDNISREFVAMGLSCEVFCRTRSGFQAASDNGRTLTYVSGSRVRQLDTIVSSIQTGWRILRNRSRYSHVFWFNNANLPGIMLTAIAGVPQSVNVDGLEWRRAKWSAPFKLYYIMASAIISIMCRRLIADSISIQTYYRRFFMKRTIYIPYGCPILEKATRSEEDVLGRYQLSKAGYFLQVTRFEPDNLPLEVALGFVSSGLAEEGYKCVIVGFKDLTGYAGKLKELSGSHGVVVLDAIYDSEVLQVLRQNCYCYVHGNSVGGTNPALLEAMTLCPRVMAVDLPFSREVLSSEIGVSFRPLDLPDAFRDALLLEDQSALMIQRVSQYYRWYAVGHSYASLALGRTPDYLALIEQEVPDDERKRSELA